MLAEVPTIFPTAQAFWRSDIDALTFPVESHSASCVVHRRAFRTLLRFEPTPRDCLQYFHERSQAFRLAANAKITQKNIPMGTNLHLTSREIGRKLVTSQLQEENST
jgi:hypothetical protein